MRHLILLLVLFATPLAAEEPGFTSKPAKDAYKSYERDVAKARKAYDDAVEAARKEYEQQVSGTQKSYKEELIEAAKGSADKRDFDEVARINAEVKRMESLEPGATLDPVEALRRKVAGTKWTWRDGITVSFEDSGVIEMSDGKKGRWEAVSENEVFVKWQNLWHYTFDFEKRTYESRPYYVSTSDSEVVAGRLLKR